MTSCGSLWQSGGAVAVIPVTADVPADALLTVVCAINNNNAYTGATATDSRGNVYTLTGVRTGSTPVTALAVFWTTVATPLVAGDTVTVNLSVTTSRQAYVADYYAGLNSPGPSSTNGGTGSGSTSAINAGAVAPAAADDLVFMGVATSGTDPVTAGAGFTVGSSIVTGVGTNERRATSLYGFAPSTAPITGTATLPAPAGWNATDLAFDTGSAPPPVSVTWSYWDGTTEQPVTWSYWDGASELPVTSWETV